MLFPSVFVKILVFFIVCWLGKATCQSQEDLDVGRDGSREPSKQEFPVWDDANGEWPGAEDSTS